MRLNGKKSKVIWLLGEGKNLTLCNQSGSLYLVRILEIKRSLAKKKGNNEWNFNLKRRKIQTNLKLDEVEQHIVICQLRAKQLIICRSRRLRQIIDLQGTDK